MKDWERQVLKLSNNWEWWSENNWYDGCLIALCYKLDNVKSSLFHQNKMRAMASSLGFKVRGSSENKGRLKEAIELMLESYSKMLFVSVVVYVWLFVSSKASYYSQASEALADLTNKLGWKKGELSDEDCQQQLQQKLAEIRSLSIVEDGWFGKALKIGIIVGPSMISIFNAVYTFFLYMNNCLFWAFLGLLIILGRHIFRRHKTRLTCNVSTREVQVVVPIDHVRAIYRLTAVPFICTCLILSSSPRADFSQFSSWRNSD